MLNINVYTQLAHTCSLCNKLYHSSLYLGMFSNMDMAECEGMKVKMWHKVVCGGLIDEQMSG